MYRNQRDRRVAGALVAGLLLVSLYYLVDDLRLLSAPQHSPSHEPFVAAISFTAIAAVILIVFRATQRTGQDFPDD